MSAANTTKIFGMRIGIDPKILIGGLIALAAFLFWYNSRTEDGETAPASAARPASVPSNPVASNPATSAPAAGQRTPPVRRATNQVNDRSRLRLRPIDATRGDVDPTLRLDLLHRLSAVKFEPARRSIFEIGATPSQQAQQLQAIAKNHPIIPPKPLPVPQPSQMPAAPPPVNIPLKYYGFVKPAERGQSNQGLFLDGDNILLASEGQVLKQRYMVVELTPNNARMEDTSMKQGQVLPVVPAALQQQ